MCAMNAPPVQYVKTTDGYDIAFTVCGGGKSLISFPPGFESVETLWDYYPDWMQGLASRFRLISFDARGEGLSTRGLYEGTTIEDFRRDVEALTNRFEGERFVFHALGARGHDAVRFAFNNPERVEAIIWNIASIKNSAWPVALFRELSQQNWPLFLDTLAGHAGLAGEARRRRAEDHARCVNIEDLKIWHEVYIQSDIETELKELQVPLLVLHPRAFPTLPVAESMKVASTTPNSRFVPIDGEIVYGDAAQGLRAIDDFIASLPRRAPLPAPTPISAGTLSSREVEVLRLLAQGRSNQQIADELVISLNTVNRHVSNIYAKTGAANRAEAASYATRNGLAG